MSTENIISPSYPGYPGNGQLVIYSLKNPGEGASPGLIFGLKKIPCKLWAHRIKEGLTQLG
jgi:hypothetical protein